MMAAENNFNLLRLVFALMVVAYHTAFLSGVAHWSALIPWLSLLAEIGVQGFFVLSGYLVYASLKRSTSLGLYAEKRFRRLYPAYAVVVLICGAAGLAFSSVTQADSGPVTLYLGANLVFANFVQPGLPGVFDAPPNIVSEINGALWTLKIEVMFYALLPMLAWLLRLAGRGRWTLIAAIYVGAEAWRFCFEAAGQAELSRQLPGQMSYFITGIALNSWLDKLNWRSVLVPFGVILLVTSVAFPLAEPLRAAGVGILAVWLAIGIPKLFDAARFGDLSYGLYIVHFPIIQCVVAAGLFASSPGLAIGLVAAACLTAALALWWLIERPALRRDSAYRLAA